MHKATINERKKKKTVNHKRLHSECMRPTPTREKFKDHFKFIGYFLRAGAHVVDEIQLAVHDLERKEILAVPVAVAVHEETTLLHRPELEGYGALGSVVKKW